MLLDDVIAFSIGVLGGVEEEVVYDGQGSASIMVRRED
jgi:hypothetical protein